MEHSSWSGRSKIRRSFGPQQGVSAIPAGVELDHGWLRSPIVPLGCCSCCTVRPEFLIISLTCGVTRIRTPNLLHAIQRQDVYHRPYAQSPSQGIRTRPLKSRPVAVLPCCTGQLRQVKVPNQRMTSQSHFCPTAYISLRAGPLWKRRANPGYAATPPRQHLAQGRVRGPLVARIHVAGALLVLRKHCERIPAYLLPTAGPKLT
jgi:hypothetical protein